MNVALHTLLDTFRQHAKTEREKGNYFERLVKTYLLNEPSYKDLFNGQVYLWEEWRVHCMKSGQSDPGVDAGIDLVAVEYVKENPRIFAIQAKFYDESAKIRKGDGIDSFFSAMGKKPYTNGLLFLTTYSASHHVLELVQARDKPINIISLSDLETSVIDWSQYQPEKPQTIKPKKSLRDHQKTAVHKVIAGLKESDRGKLIMACGTGKTFTSLKIAEQLAGKGGRVLFLVPSLSLLSQTLTEWTQESETPLHSFAVCSDSDVGKKKDADDVQMLMHELRYPATTEPRRLAEEMTKRHDDQHMSVVFSTYHSINVISEAQKDYHLANFDLIICDEAHRTTGATFESEDESNFVKVHDANFIRSTKRLYMTATPRIYGELAKAKAESDNVALCSMDDPALYGRELHVITFSEAVQRGLLCDYKVLVLSVEESHINRRLQELFKDEDNQLKVDDAAKIIGCWKALAKQGMAENLSGDTDPMKRAVAFCQVIEANYKGKTHKVSSKNIAAMFQKVVEAYQEQEEIEPAAQLICEAEHIDGSMNASEKESKLQWLKAETPENTCRILSNVRCLSEGVDVPALDAVLFLTPRNSQVDVVQSVGRVMRNAPGKKRGYVILPVVIPAGLEPHEALNDNNTYKVVWQVLQALRSHDDRFDAMVNKMDLDLNRKIMSKMEVIAITDKIQPKQRKATGTTNRESGKGQYGIGKQYDKPGQITQNYELAYEVGEIERAIYAKVVEKCGNRHHWEDWANDIARIANTHIDRIKGILANPENKNEIKAFNEFATELRDDLNNSISDGDIIEMLAQHLITKPVFDALFADYSFTSHNPMSQAMQGVLDALQEHRLNKEADTLESFYASVKMRAEGIESAQGKQKIVVELYDKFFRNAFPKMTDRLGIVYTPVEVVDFIIQSVNHILKTEFGQTLGSKGIHIIDPFTGTGTFITRLLQSGLIKPEELPHKYLHEIHANEIVLLAYYIAAINIESVYHSLVGGDYQPFEGICLTDTFQMYEKEDLVDALLVDNSARRKRQKKLDIRVIIGNPPYSAGQTSANDNNQNVAYPGLDERIRSTYAERSKATLKNALYDSYIRAIRWASDRIGSSGVIGFVTNAGFLEANTADGLRKCLTEEFSSIYIFHLRGNQRTQGEQSRKEGGKIFGSGSRAPIAISLLVKNPAATQQGHIYFHDIGDYLKREEKLEIISAFASIEGITEAGGWQAITPNEHGDWLSQRDDSFSEFIDLGDKKSPSNVLFSNYSSGVKTNRDAWCYNASQNSVKINMENMINFYNSEVSRFQHALNGADETFPSKSINDFINTDPTKISWDHAQKIGVERGRLGKFTESHIVKSLYRPFTKNWLYFDRFFNNRVYQMPRIFPDAEVENLVICVSGVGARSFSTLITDTLPCLDNIEKGQCFPLYLYESAESGNEQESDESTQEEIFANSNAAEASGYTRKEALTDEGLAHFQKAYPGEKISKEDVFFYVYGLLHSPDYRERYADNLSKELPRIPCVKKASDFWRFSKAGRELATLHVNYDSVKPYPVKLEVSGKRSMKQLEESDYRVEKMKFASKGDKSSVIYNAHITIKEIPAEAWEYVVNGKAALDWVMERQCVKTDKASGIVNDANDWAIETMGNPKYPLELFQRVITVSVETIKIVTALPKLDI
ncbi:DEAD/DEAH box helicase [Permianibacter aggregans]|uniref:Putative helicase n=1 Tax=Permianibacter aggregans TaxID=1510150 RepID=A0A4R6URI5_9GAMM|nr:type ISP restriction/modification enzyme [Permianibacter aggregans]QGX39375.1 DEAD/DEAH box helicase [Permianibacter aggregans]TDQ49890.1 putative helicase [Permianibacter aggregans]